MFDHSKLIGRIIEKYGTRDKFASTLGRSKNYVSRVLNGKALLRADDVLEWADVLDISPEEIGAYFFTRKVHEVGF